MWNGFVIDWITVRGPLHGMEIAERPLSSQKLARSLNNLSKAMKKLFLWEILVYSLISQPSLLSSGKFGHTERSLRDNWEIDEIVERSLSVHWEIAFLGDHWEIVLEWVKTLRRPWRSLGDHWQIINRSGHFFIAQRSLNDRNPCIKGVSRKHHNMTLLECAVLPALPTLHYT